MIIRGKRIKNLANSNLVTTSSLQERRRLEWKIREMGEAKGTEVTLKDIPTNRKVGMTDIALNI